MVVMTWLSEQTAGEFASWPSEPAESARFIQQGAGL
jgi:hypothetical protein